MQLSVVILAAGQGKRMKSALPKVLQPLAGRPLLKHVIDVAQSLEPAAVSVVYGHGGDAVREALKAEKVSWALQAQQLGTGHAVMQALPAMKDDALVLVLYGDVPLIRRDTLDELVKLAGPKAMSLLTMVVDDPTGYGRIVRNARDQVTEDRRAEGRLEGATEDPRMQHRHPRRAREAAAQVARQAEERQLAGRVLPHRHRRDGGEGQSEGQSARLADASPKCWA